MSSTCISSDESAFSRDRTGPLLLGGSLPELGLCELRASPAHSSVPGYGLPDKSQRQLLCNSGWDSKTRASLCPAQLMEDCPHPSLLWPRVLLR